MALPLPVRIHAPSAPANPPAVEAERPERWSSAVRTWITTDGAVARLTQAHTVSTAADAFIAVVLAGSLFFSVSIDVARPRLALYLLLTVAPFAVLTPIIGPIADRFGSRQRAFLAFTCQARAVLALFIALDGRAMLLYPESFAILALGRAYAIAKRSFVPALVRSDELVATNARLSRVGSLAGATGGALAAATLAGTGTNTVLRVAAILHLGASAIALRIPQRTPQTAPGPRGTGRTADRSRLIAVRRARSTMIVLRTAAGLATFLVAFSLKASGASTLAFGAMAFCVMAASIAGTVVSPWLRRAVTAEWIPLVLSCVVAATVCTVALWRDDLAGMLLAVACLSLVGSIARHFFDSVVQRTLSGSARHRAFARAETLMQIAFVLGALAPTQWVLDNRQGYILLIGLTLLASLFASRWPAREEAPDGAADQPIRATT